ncbi:DEAD/DEAH box helicase [Limibacillus halophilus]|uniref:ATP-dependent RNA helicase RhlE n=1 Tax=Limibacillus halophilus TaxID=1579333 RepID=A0A839STM0_9PROT|nr:DEAD/DEAH box helicase [Limibacillus halophilus]MBB3066197.1 ATP-dependent RNA helicase RhlE [Limibacillus halophilus]
MTNTTFSDLGLTGQLLSTLEAARFHVPTPIQAKTIPLILSGKDVLGIAQTGTGKTGAFALPLLQQLAENRVSTKNGRIRALILAPTRELAVQIEAALRIFGRQMRLYQVAVYGGVGRRPQIEQLRRGVDIVIATPGRFLDLYDEGHIDMSNLSHLVLDEADRMLDMGFINDIRRIVSGMPKERRSLLFSATMPKTIDRLAAEILNQPARVEMPRESVAPAAIEQRVIHVPTPEKRELLTTLLRDPGMSRVIVFTRTKHMANRVQEHLSKAGTQAEALHGNKSQAARQQALKRFRSGNARVLVATDVAARGIDVTAISHVINFDLPNEPESYVHRIGRTARAGGSGVALSFCGRDEIAYLRDIERLIGLSLPAEGDVPSAQEMASMKHVKPGRGRRGPGGHGGGRGRNGSSQGGPGRGAPGRSGAGRNGPSGQEGGHRSESRKGGQANAGRFRGTKRAA